MRRFEGFLKSAGRVTGVVLQDVLKYALPVATLLSTSGAVPVTPAEETFLAVLRLSLSAVMAVEQKWAGVGTGHGPRKLADVLQIVETPVLMMFAAAGITVDRAYVTELVNALVALLNAQPADRLPTASA